MTETPPEAKPQRRSLPNVATRALTVIILLPLTLWIAVLGGWIFTILILGVVTLAMLEFFMMETEHESQGSALVGIPAGLLITLSFHLRDDSLWMIGLGAATVLTFLLEMARHRNINRSLKQLTSTLGALFYIAFPAGFLIGIRGLDQPHDIGILWIFVIFTLTWGTDTIAYIGGRWFGKTPFVPRISPKKTREGAVFGVVGGIILPIIILQSAGLLSLPTLVIIIIGPFVAIIGDLFESALKRFFKVKDSHIKGLNIIPGHGGMLDRIDALLWVVTLIYIYLALTGPTGVLP